MFATSRFWTSLRGRFMPGVDEGAMPASLLSAMSPTDEGAVVALLRLLAPVSTRLGLYGLKWNPFLEDIPVEALCETPRLKHFAWRIEDLVTHGGFALITGDVGAGKSAALRMLASNLAPLREVIVGEITRPQSRVTDFYREIGKNRCCCAHAAITGHGSPWTANDDVLRFAGSTFTNA